MGIAGVCGCCSLLWRMVGVTSYDLDGDREGGEKKRKEKNIFKKKRTAPKEEGTCNVKKQFVINKHSV